MRSRRQIERDRVRREARRRAVRIGPGEPTDVTGMTDDADLDAEDLDRLVEDAAERPAGYDD